LRALPRAKEIVEDEKKFDRFLKDKVPLTICSLVLHQPVIWHRVINKNVRIACLQLALQVWRCTPFSLSDHSLLVTVRYW
jgi:hypothetical protein